MHVHTAILNVQQIAFIKKRQFVDSLTDTLNQISPLHHQNKYSPPLDIIRKSMFWLWAISIINIVVYVASFFAWEQRTDMRDEHLIDLASGFPQGNPLSNVFISKSEGWKG